jgi:transposase
VDKNEPLPRLTPTTSHHGLTHRRPDSLARTGSKHRLLVDATGIPLAVALTGGNRNDVTQLLPLVDDLHLRPVAGRPGRPRQKPNLVIADRGCDHDKYRRQLWARGIKPMIARRGAEHGFGVGRQRWVVERGFAHLHNFPACGPATSAIRRSTPRCLCSPARSSAGDDSAGSLLRPPVVAEAIGRCRLDQRTTLRANLPARSRHRPRLASCPHSV